MFIRNPFNWNIRFGTIPSEFREAMTYEEQIQWLYYQIKELKDGTANYNYELLENKPSINGIMLSGNLTTSQLGIDSNYNNMVNKPSINGVTLQGSLSLNDLGIQSKLVAGIGIQIVGDTISVIGGGSGGTSDYRALQNKPSINGVMLDGNLTSKNLNLQNELSYDLNDYNYETSISLLNINVNDVILPPYSEILDATGSNMCYIEINKYNGMHVDIEGEYNLVSLDKDNKVTSTFSTNGESISGYFDSTSGGKLFIGFFNINETGKTPRVKIVETGTGNKEITDDLKKDNNITSDDLNLFFRKNFDYQDLTADLDEGEYYNANGNNQVDIIQEANSKSIAIDGRIAYSGIYIKGKCLNSSMIIYVDSNNIVQKRSPVNMCFNTLTYFKLDIPENCRYILFSFRNTDELSPELKVMDISKIESEIPQSVIKGFANVGDTILNSNGTISEAGQVETWETGLYCLDYPIFVGSVSPSNLMYSVGEFVLYDKTYNVFYGAFKQLTFDSQNQEWRNFGKLNY